MPILSQYTNARTSNGWPIWNPTWRIHMWCQIWPCPLLLCVEILCGPLVYSVFCILCILYSLHLVLSVSCILCILNSLYIVFSVYCLTFWTSASPHSILNMHPTIHAKNNYVTFKWFSRSIIWLCITVIAADNQCRMAGAALSTGM